MSRMLAPVVCLLALAAIQPAPGSIASFTTPGGALLLDGPVSASAIFSSSDGALDITLSNNLIDPANVGQLVSNLQFTLSGGATATLSSSAGALITINNNKTYTTPGSPVPTGWDLRTVVGGLLLCVICPGTNAAVGPAHTIIGLPGGATYASSSGSIHGNDPHNPFIYQSAAFHITSASITPDTLVSNVLFGFSTTSGRTVPGILTQGDDPGVPEPATYSLIGTVLVAGAYLLRRRR